MRALLMLFACCLNAYCVEVVIEDQYVIAANTMTLVLRPWDGTANTNNWYQFYIGETYRLNLPAGKYMLANSADTATNRFFIFTLTNSTPDIYAVRFVVHGNNSAVTQADRTDGYNRYGWWITGFLVGLPIAGFYWIFGFVQTKRGAGLDV